MEKHCYSNSLVPTWFPNTIPFLESTCHRQVVSHYKNSFFIMDWTLKWEVWYHNTYFIILLPSYFLIKILPTIHLKPSAFKSPPCMSVLLIECYWIIVKHSFTTCDSSAALQNSDIWRFLYLSYPVFQIYLVYKNSQQFLTIRWDSFHPIINKGQTRFSGTSVYLLFTLILPLAIKIQVVFLSAWPCVYSLS